jgi:UrcA family protein
MIMRMLVRHFAPYAICSTLSAVLAVAAPPALAQPASEEFNVTVQNGFDGKPESLSYPVTFADLDLRKKDGRDELQRRVDVTANYLCAKLEDNDVWSCTQKAISDVSRQVWNVENQAIAQVTFTPGQAWTAPGQSTHLAMNTRR